MKKKESIFQLLTQKPWENDQSQKDNVHEGKTLDLTKYKLGLRTLMVVSSVIVSVFRVTDSDRR